MSENDAQRRSPSYLLATADQDFLLRDEMRGLRFQLEYAKAELALRDWRIRSTVVVFGSARIPSPEAAPLTGLAPGLMRLAPYYEKARAFARIVSERGGAMPGEGLARDNVIATGGGPGIMEAANRGAVDVGAPSIGFNISLPLEQEPNRYSTPTLTFRFHYFAMRKMHLAMRANALAVFPGGFGTLDELFEILTLQQTRKAPAAPVVLFGKRYWRRLVNFDALARDGMVTRADLALFEIVDDAEAGWAAMLRRGLVAHGPARASPREAETSSGGRSC